MEKLENFKKLGLSENTLKTLEKKGFEVPSPIQELAIPILLENKIDIIGQAQTGTGKTAAFGLPLIEKLNERSKNVQALILAPTRELAIQVAEELNSLRGDKKLQIVPIYGGQSIDTQLRRLSKGVDIIVGTPGRIIDHINRGKLRLDMITHLVLDEADEMLNMGFIEDIEKILSSCNKNKRVMLFSATMPERILSIAKKYMGEYKILSVKKKELTTSLTDQIYFEVASEDRLEALCRIIDIEANFYGIVFCRTKIDTDWVAKKLSNRGYDAEALHGDITQFNRERILYRFKNKKTNILIATDVAARGIDVEHLSHVINYSLPQDPEAYVHRIGRTGRAGREGKAITFVTPDEYRKLVLIKKIAKTDIRKENIPGVKDVINIKKNRIKDELQEIINKKIEKTYETITAELLVDNDPQDIISALLKFSFRNDLEERRYHEIKTINIDRTGKSRLFVALGREDDINPKILIDMIKKKTDIHDRKIKDIRVFDKFSFITVPFEEAELILEMFKTEKRGRRPIFTVARDRNSENKSSSSSYERKSNYDKNNNREKRNTSRFDSRYSKPYKKKEDK